MPPIFQPGAQMVSVKHQDGPLAQPIVLTNGGEVTVLGGLSKRLELAGRIAPGIAGETTEQVARQALQIADDLLRLDALDRQQKNRINGPGG